jgi:hypothetical protein
MLKKKLTRKGTMLSSQDPNETIYNDLVNNPLEYEAAIEQLNDYFNTYCSAPQQLKHFDDYLC